MAGRGPAPKHPTTRARRNAPMANMTQLPAEGRKGPTPAWPLPPDQRLRASVDAAETEAALIEADLQHVTDADERRKLRGELRRALVRAEVASNDLRISEKQELALWKVLWALPQAVAWERLDYLNEVGQYVRWKVRAELGELQASKEARLVGDRLGLTPASMLHLRWEIVSDELADRRGDPPPATPASRRRMPAKKTGRKPPDPRAALSMVK